MLNNVGTRGSHTEAVERVKYVTFEAEVLEHYCKGREGKKRVKHNAVNFGWTCSRLLSSIVIMLFLIINQFRCGTVVKVLCYKFEGRWFDSRWCHWNFSLT